MWRADSKREILQSPYSFPATSRKYLGTDQELKKKFLGMCRRPKSDILQKSEISTHTMRRVLSMYSQFSTPLDYSDSFQKILQKIWRSGVSRDDVIKDSDENEWQAWQSSLSKLSNLSIPPYMCSHIFVASLDTYAAVALNLAAKSDVVCEVESKLSAT